MILNCPSCGARFVVESASFAAGGRQVRCGVCSHAWYQAADPDQVEELDQVEDEEMLEDEPFEAEAAPEVEAAGEDDPAEDQGQATAAVAPEAGGEERLARLEAFDEERRHSTGDPAALDEGRKGMSVFTIAWVALLIFVAALAGIAWFGKEAVVAQFPEASKLYSKLGIETMAPSRVGDGLELQDVNSFKRDVGGTRTLVIEGSVVNISDREQELPALRAVITDAEGGQITEWTFRAQGDSLPPGGRAAFETSTEDPERGVNLSLIFVER